jgi:hypothetical protein
MRRVESTRNANHVRFAMMAAHEQHSTVRRLATVGWSTVQMANLTGLQPAQIQAILQHCTP